MLHAYKLGFTHPRSGKLMEFTAPVPDDMAKLCEN
jgi:23S rRNA pseudouridine1911/1915/1917 synthase